SARATSFSLFPYTTLFRSAVGEYLLDLGKGLFRLEAAVDLGKDGLLLLRRQPRNAGRRRDRNLAGRQSVYQLANTLLLDLVGRRSEEHTSELQSPYDLVCR